MSETAVPTIRVTERGTFKRCRKRWDYSSRQGLVALSTPIALSFGKMWHRGHELWINHPDADPVEIFMVIAAAELDTTKERYRKAVGTGISEVELGPFYDVVELGRDMFANYKAKWGGPIPGDFELIKQEQTLLVPVSHEGKLIAYLQGTLDGLLVNAKGHYFVLERKTYGSRPRVEVLQTNDQFISYCWMLSVSMPEIADPSQIGGILYDGAWKRKFEGKRTLDDLFLRVPLLRNAYEINLFGDYLVQEMLDMTDPNMRMYLNRRWEGCWDCPFERLCTAESKGEDSEYVKSHYYTIGEADEETDFTATSETA